MTNNFGFNPNYSLPAQQGTDDAIGEFIAFSRKYWSPVENFCVNNLSFVQIEIEKSL